MFEEEDIIHLAGRLSREELLQEIRHAEVQQGVCRQWAEDYDSFYWREFGNACRAAIRIQEAREPKIGARPGKVSIAATKQANDIADVVSRYTDLRNAGKELTGCCPFHDDKNPSLRVSQEKQVFYCFSCGRKGDVIDFVSEMEGLDVKGACRFLVGNVRTQQEVKI